MSNVQIKGNQLHEDNEAMVRKGNITVRRQRILSLRKVTSLTLVLSGIILIVSSVVLFLGPPTHVAFFTEWSWGGLAKDQWNALHVVNGLMFSLLSILHGYYNWKAIVFYLMNRSKRVVILTCNFIIAISVTISICICAVKFLPPARQIMHLGHTINQGYLREYGVFPCVHGDRCLLWKAAMYLGIEETALILFLEKKGIVIHSRNQSASDIAKTNNVSREMVIKTIIDASSSHNIHENTK